MNYNIAVAGAGIGGLSAGLALVRLGHQITIYERGSGPGEMGAGIVLSHNAMANLETWGISDAIRAAGLSLESMNISTASGRLLSVASSTTQYRGRELCAVGVHRSKLISLLVQTCKETRGIQLHFGHALSEVSTDASGVHLDSLSGKVSHDILIGADGIHSKVREFLYGPSRVRYAGYRCFRGIAEGDFGLGTKAAELWGRGRRFGLVPISKSQVYWFAVENAEPGETVSVAERHDYVRSRFGEFGAVVTQILAGSPSEEILLHDLGDLPLLEHWGRGRVTLLGDAAHAMTPNLGQGAGQAIEDAAFLAQAFERAQPSGSPEDILRSYEHARIDRANGFVVKSARLGRIAQSEHPFTCWLRNLALFLTPNRLTEVGLTQLLKAGVPHVQSMATSQSA